MSAQKIEFWNSTSATPIGDFPWERPPRWCGTLPIRSCARQCVSKCWYANRACTITGARDGATLCRERVEHGGHDVRRHAGARVGDVKLHIIRNHPSTEYDRAALGRVFERVCDEIEQHLLQPPRIAQERGLALFAFE